MIPARDKSRRPRYVRRCGSGTLLLAQKTKAGEIKHRGIRMRCGSWRCDICARTLSHKWWTKLAQVKDISLGVTLTIDPADYPDALAAERGLYGALARLVKRWRRAFGWCEYFAAVEWHRSRWPHLHVLVRGDPPTKTPGELKRWLDEHGVASGFGRVSWVTPIYNSEGACSYVLSDVTKTYQLRNDYPAGFRRIRVSRNFFAEVEWGEPEKPVAWVILGTRLEQFLEELRRSGATVTAEVSVPLVAIDGEPAGVSLEEVTYEPAPGSRYDLLTGGGP